MHQEDTWYTLTSVIVHEDKPTMFGLQDINPVASHTFTESQDAGMYTHNELKGFWDSIVNKAASKTALKKFSQLPKKEQTVHTIIPHEPSSLWIS